MGNSQAGLLDKFGSAEKYEPTNPVSADPIDSEKVQGLMELDKPKRLAAYAHAGVLLSESTMLTCLCLEMSHKDSKLPLHDQKYGDRTHTKCFDGTYIYIYWLGMVKPESSSTHSFCVNSKS